MRRSPRESANVRKITAHGKTMSIRNWSAYTNIPIDTLRKRYQKGDRGEQVVRPLDHGGHRKPTTKIPKYAPAEAMEFDNPFRHGSWV